MPTFNIWNVFRIICNTIQRTFRESDFTQIETRWYVIKSVYCHVIPRITKYYCHHEAYQYLNQGIYQSGLTPTTFVSSWILLDVVNSMADDDTRNIEQETENFPEDSFEEGRHNRKYQRRL